MTGLSRGLFRIPVAHLRANQRLQRSVGRIVTAC
jgi:hypothetical protein